MKFGAIILAGGRGERFRGRKQFLDLRGKPLWKHVYDKAVQALGSDVNIVKVGIDFPGGDTRTDSVKLGLSALDDDTDRVVIVEAARPLVTVRQLKQLLLDPAPSAAFVMPLVNTVVMRDGSYIDRDEMYELLTPQAFDFQKLASAYATGKHTDMTDETRVMFEEYAIRAHFIETDDNLIKVTYPRDVAVVEGMLQSRGDLL
ncbi:IspD/TarI family cytidylyltransferase [Gordonibacter massiliensis (ex Traore et al. 2017)]|uniref:2-C-methyl-D-erythritol 4-phosphate cytidylyltransferase n=1 Tax=Gordonibacter massiliensis (ex Traore et al. 2017) TaxID=1841863 RepID=A0A842JG73_9ACTN|nr:2-C-methyl-D-erythritol 4-phosphate cytidylyltransferase [Gordonibacter massiliensis (ex Traore et al. 2017)]MBC2889996.1 2-C-methyl-D-erythritol 4-phosphate cytidylyltransferase [Gordonibacter massiliensis (ex Traore et al. 2017)]